MDGFRMKNLIRETKEISKRILQELGKLAKPKPQLQPIPIPVRKFYKSNYAFSNFYCHGFRNKPTACIEFVRNCCSFNGFAGFHHHRPFNGYMKGKPFWKFKFFFRNFTQSSKILRQVPKNGYYYNYFSQAGQNGYRAKLYSNWNKSIWNQLKEFKFDTNSQKDAENKFVANRYKSNVNNAKKSSIRLNLSLTATNHQLTLSLAKTDSTASHEDKVFADAYIPGSYLEFPVKFSFDIPDETLLTQEIMDEMMDNIQRFQSKLKTLQDDLLGLFDLGELPIKYIADRQVIQIYFANCDKQKLQVLCVEKGIVGGIIYEENEKDKTSTYTSNSDSQSFTDQDILSSSYKSDGSVSSYDGDVLSDSWNGMDDNQIVRLTNDCVVPEIVNIEAYDEFHWV